MTGWADEVLGYWFSLDPRQWWSDESLDGEIAARFEALWREQRQCPADRFLATPREALAAILLFDQFPRNMFRGHAEQLATDPLALAVARAAVDRGYDEGMSAGERLFLYLPFQHSENRADQQRSLALYTALGEPEPLRYAKLHHDVIERYGRFPHRNFILGRKPRDDEIEAGDVVPW